MDPTTAKSITISGKYAYHNCLRRGFTELINNGGYFVRYKQADDQYKWDRVVRIVFGDKYLWKKKFFDVIFVCESGDALKLPSISDQDVSAEEIDAARNRVTGEQLYAVADRAAAMAAALEAFAVPNPVMSMEDCKYAIEVNTRMGIQVGNVVAQLSDSRASVVAPASPLGNPNLFASPRLSTPGGAAAGAAGAHSFSQDNSFALNGSGFMSPIGTQPNMTPMYRESSAIAASPPLPQAMFTPEFEQELASNELLRAQVVAKVQQMNRFNAIVEDKERIKESLHIVALTARNRERNKTQILEALDAQKQMAVRTGKLEESGLLWEVDQSRRQQLCEDYEKEEKEAKDDKKDGGGAGKSAQQKNKRLAEGNSAGGKSLSELSSQIPDEVLEEARRSSNLLSRASTLAAEHGPAPLAASSSSAPNAAAATSSPVVVITTQQAALRLRALSSTSPAASQQIGSKRARSFGDSQTE